jgi:urease accessory protein
MADFTSEASGLSGNAYPSEAMVGVQPDRSGLALERAVGKLSLVVERADDGAHALRDLAQSGCARLLFPARRAADPLEAVIVNTGGGLTGGDLFELRAEVAAGAETVFTTQAAEKIYRSDGSFATVATRISAATGAQLSWMPQEMILFEGGALRRTLDVSLDDGASALLAESVVLGRAAMGERLDQARLTDSWRVRRGGKLVFAEETRVENGWTQAFARKAALGGEAAGYATVVLVDAEAEMRIDDVRGLLSSQAVEAGASAFDGMLVVRLIAHSGLALRRAIAASLELLAGRALPRIWHT